MLKLDVLQILSLPVKPSVTGSSTLHEMFDTGEYILQLMIVLGGMVLLGKIKMKSRRGCVLRIKLNFNSIWGGGAER